MSSRRQNIVPSSPPPGRPWWRKKRYAVPLSLLAFLLVVGALGPAPKTTTSTLRQAGSPAGARAVLASSTPTSTPGLGPVQSLESTPTPDQAALASASAQAAADGQAASASQQAAADAAAATASEQADAKAQADAAAQAAQADAAAKAQADAQAKAQADVAKARADAAAKAQAEAAAQAQADAAAQAQAAAAAAAAAVAASPPAPPADALASSDFTNCIELNAVYPHGVGMPGAVDHVASGRPGVTTFTRDAALYQANSSHDGDGDGIACERK